jgi:hypothetical protein
MNAKKTVLVLALFVLGSAVAESALAHGYGRARVGVGFYFGVPLGGWGYGYPGYGYPYYPPYYSSYPVYAPSQPATYIQQDVQPAPAASPQQGYWYYCSDAQAYYPYVKECPGGWQRVSPQPAR